MIYKIGVHPLSHALEWKSGGGKWLFVSPALRATDYKCPHCLLIEYDNI